MTRALRNDAVLPLLLVLDALKHYDTCLPRRTPAQCKLLIISVMAHAGVLMGHDFGVVARRSNPDSRIGKRIDFAHTYAVRQHWIAPQYGEWLLTAAGIAELEQRRATEECQRYAEAITALIGPQLPIPRERRGSFFHM